MQENGAPVSWLVHPFPVTLTLLQGTSHSEIDTSRLPWRQLAEQATANVSSSKTFFFVNYVYTNNVLNARVHV